MDLQNNSSVVALSANAVFKGTTIKLDQKFMTCTINIDTDVSGTVAVYHSQDGFNFYTFGDSFSVNGQFHREVILKGLYFYVRYTNGANAQTLFNLFTKLSLNVRDQTASGGGSGGDVNITGCEVTLPISGSVTCDISGQTVVVSGVATEATLLDTYNLLNDNIGTGGLSVSLTALDGEKITNTVIDTKRGLDVNMINSLTVDISGQTVLVDISGQTVDISGQTVLVDISGQTVDISGQTVLVDISGQTVLVDISGQTVDISGQRVITDISGQTVNIGNAVSANVLNVNSTVYDYVNDYSTMTQADNRFDVDRVRPDSWSFTNTKNQNGSNVFWYSNAATSPLGVQQFNILHGDLESLYFVAGINRTEDRDALPFLVVYSPSSIAFYTSRWVYLVDPTEKLIQGEKVLLYYGVDPVSIHTNIRHVRLLYNAIASQGPQLESEVCYLISCNSASALPASSVYYNLYNAGFILNDVKKTHNDYAFDSGIKSRGDSLLANLNNIDGYLGVSVENVVSANILNTSYSLIGENSCLNVNVGNVADIPISNTALTFMSYKGVSAGTFGLEVVNRNVEQATTYLFTEDDLTITDETPSIDVRTFRLMSVFGNSTHTGGGSHNIIMEYSTNNNTWFDSPNVIPSVANKFAVDLKDFCVSYIRFRFQVEITDLNMNVCLK
jgi:hypothetical protein